MPGGDRGPVRTVQQTAKRWKAMQLLAWLLMAAGTTAVYLGRDSGAVVLGAAGLVVFGFFMLLAAWFLAWWHHG